MTNTTKVPDTPEAPDTLDTRGTPKVSVIVPVYKVENYLAHCLRSIRGQSLREIEIICVNDGSPDASGVILRMSAALDSRIRVIEKENGGLSSARNAGIEAARGSYLMFVDSDDSLEGNACKKVVEAFEEHDSDIVTFGANCYPAGRVEPWYEDILGPRDVHYDSFHGDIVFKEKSRPFVWRTAVRASFLRESGVLFDEATLFGEDQLFHFAVYPRAHRTTFLSDLLYNYRVIRKGSLMHGRSREVVARIKTHLLIAERVLEDWKQLGLLEPYVGEMLAWTVEFTTNDLYLQDPEDQKPLLDSFRALVASGFAGFDFWKIPMTGELRKLLGSLLDSRTQVVGERLFLKWWLAHMGELSIESEEPRGILGALRRVLRHILPTPTKSMQLYLGEQNENRVANVWGSQEEQMALILLLAEYRLFKEDKPKDDKPKDDKPKDDNPKDDN